MDVRETLLNVVQSDNPRYSFVAIERLILAMLQDHVKKQDKAVLLERHSALCDMILPNGIDDISEKVAVEIKVSRHKQMFLKVIYDTIGRFAVNRGDINTLILIIVNEIPEIAMKQLQEKMTY